MKEEKFSPPPGLVPKAIVLTVSYADPLLKQ